MLQIHHRRVPAIRYGRLLFHVFVQKQVEIGHFLLFRKPQFPQKLQIAVVQVRIVADVQPVDDPNVAPAAQNDLVQDPRLLQRRQREQSLPAIQQKATRHGRILRLRRRFVHHDTLHAKALKQIVVLVVTHDGQRALVHELPVVLYALLVPLRRVPPLRRPLLQLRDQHAPDVRLPVLPGQHQRNGRGNPQRRLPIPGAPANPQNRLRVALVHTAPRLISEKPRQQDVHHRGGLPDLVARNRRHRRLVPHSIQQPALPRVGLPEIRPVRLPGGLQPLLGRVRNRRRLNRPAQRHPPARNTAGTAATGTPARRPAPTASRPPTHARPQHNSSPTAQVTCKQPPGPGSPATCAAMPSLRYLRPSTQRALRHRRGIRRCHHNQVRLRRKPQRRIVNNIRHATLQTRLRVRHKKTPRRQPLSQLVVIGRLQSDRAILVRRRRNVRPVKLPNIQIPSRRNRPHHLTLPRVTLGNVPERHTPTHRKNRYVVRGNTPSPHRRRTHVLQPIPITPHYRSRRHPRQRHRLGNLLIRRIQPIQRQRVDPRLTRPILQ